MIYRKLTTEEVGILLDAGCTAENWNSVQVADGFSAQHVFNVRFAGEVRLGVTGTPIVNQDGVQRTTGLYNCEIVNCTIGDDVFIANIGAYIANYNIGDRVYIESVGKIVCRGSSSFGNGVSVAVINESGGREVPIYDHLDAQTAYMIAMYRHRPLLVSTLTDAIGNYTKSVTSTRGTIAPGARITGCNTIRDVNIGEYAILSCITVLTNGTIGSNEKSPTYVGAGVKAHDFICAHGAVVDNGAALNRCFIGEGCRIDHGYTVTDSLFFANCEMSNGEACSVFAGPYTVSHHKSSLLIAGYFSFFNAGSGSNQSNHLFKAGAVHQGVHERGCKFGSDSYIMLPAREGAFTVVLGRHKDHHDVSEFPYSYLVEEEGKSYLVPGANIRSYGTMRDMTKWEKRDRRGELRRDVITFGEFNPYLGERLLGAWRLCQKMLSKEGVQVHLYNRVKIKTVMLRRGMSMYAMALDAVIGKILAGGSGVSVPEGEGYKNWIDMAGFVVPAAEIEKLADRIEQGSYRNIEEISGQFAEINENYQAYSYGWALSALAEVIGKIPDGDDIREAVRRGEEAASSLESVRREDAAKDQSAMMMVGYGIDAHDKVVIERDFNAVRN